jgi:hypothetical protein
MMDHEPLRDILVRPAPVALRGFMERLDLPPWHWPGHPARWYAGDDAVAFTCPNPAPPRD